MNHVLRSLLAATLLLGALGCSPPEPFTQTHNGTLATGDGVVERDSSLYDDYNINVQAGWTVTATMTSSEFPPYVWLMGENNVNEQQGARPGSNFATVTYAVTQTGRYVVRANSMTGGQSGAYQLVIQAGPAGAPAAPGAPGAAPAAPGAAPAAPTAPAAPMAPTAPAAP